MDDYMVVAGRSPRGYSGSVSSELVSLGEIVPGLLLSTKSVASRLLPAYLLQLVSVSSWPAFIDVYLFVATRRLRNWSVLPKPIYLFTATQRLHDWSVSFRLVVS
ncbi:hypothetical protein QBC44DRAFT_369465 [Cladorrhinum sp. PSN332]|nr:hypothetical protein QBC44DRAFT_369465 [Cladorrhinum sp. PSN332]